MFKSFLVLPLTVSSPDIHFGWYSETDTLGGDVDELLAQDLAVVGAGPEARQPRQGLGIVGLGAASHAALASAPATFDRLGQAMTGAREDGRVVRPAALDCKCAARLANQNLVGRLLAFKDFGRSIRVDHGAQFRKVSAYGPARRHAGVFL